MLPGSIQNQPPELITLFSRLNDNPSELSVAQLRSMNDSLDDAHAECSELQHKVEDQWFDSFSCQSSRQLAVDDLKQYVKYPDNHLTPEENTLNSLILGPAASYVILEIKLINPRIILNGYKEIVKQLDSIAEKKSQVTRLLQAKTSPASTTGMYANHVVTSVLQPKVRKQKHRKCLIL